MVCISTIQRLPLSKIKSLKFDDFKVIDETHLMQNVIINGQAVQLMFEVDIYVPHYAFQHRTDTTTESADWLRNEKTAPLAPCRRMSIGNQCRLYICSLQSLPK